MKGTSKKSSSNQSPLCKIGGCHSAAQDLWLPGRNNITGQVPHFLDHM